RLVGDEDDRRRAFGGDRACVRGRRSGRQAFVGLRSDAGGAGDCISGLARAKQRARAHTRRGLLLRRQPLAEGACLPQPAARQRAKGVRVAGRGLGMADEVDEHGARIVARRRGYEGRMSTRRREDLDRELIELLNELRVALPGVQVLFAFLLAVPFANGFPKLSQTGRDVFFAAFLATALSTALLIAPSSYHRLRWRQNDKERMLVISNS